MATDIDWIESCIKQATSIHPAISEKTVASVSELLATPLSQRPLRAAELAEIARKLIVQIEQSTADTGEAAGAN